MASHKYRDGEFSPEKSDGCTLLSKPYNWLTGKELSFRQCCIKHDEAYWYGGSKQQRRDADRAFRDCVVSHDHLILGWVLWGLVRLFGGPRSPLHRWARNVTIIEGLARGYAAGTPKE